MRVVASKVAVAFDEPSETLGGFFLAQGLQDPLRVQVGTVAAVGSRPLPRQPFPRVGTKVLVVDNGTQIQKPDGLDCYEVRVYGAYCPFQGEPQECDWCDSVVAGCEGGMWKAFGTQVLVEPDPIEEKIGEIFLPDWCHRRNAMGTVRGVGSLLIDANGHSDLRVGDRVCYDPSKCHPLSKQDFEELGGLIPMDVLAIEYVLPIEEVIADIARVAAGNPPEPADQNPTGAVATEQRCHFVTGMSQVAA